MNSHYGRLFKYRESKGRTPLEDFLSESLADLFNRLPKLEQLSFIDRLFVPSELKSKWHSRASTSIELWMKTQVAISEGRLDILILCDKHPVIVVESKIKSPVGKRPDGSDQLQNYSQWLKRQSDESGGNVAVICLLNHLTPPPKDFIEPSSNHYEATPKLLRWSQVAAELKSLSGDDKLPLDVRTLAEELYLFLLEQDMTSESPRLEDFAAAIIFVKAGSRISKAFEDVFEHVSGLRGVFPRGSIPDDLPLAFDSEQNLMHGWKYLSAPPLKTIYFAYGIALQPNRSLAPDGALSKQNIPHEDSIFLCLGVEEGKEMKLLEEHSRALGPNWKHISFADNSIVATFRPLKTILVEPESFAGTMNAWIDEAVPQLLPLIAIMQKQAAS
ncbi:hypothetical protein ACVWZL_007344 [Bradyrhizobium sp. GM2.4]